MLGSGPQVVAGLTELWGPTEHVMDHHKSVSSTAFSHDGSRVVSGSRNVRIWNATTGELVHILDEIGRAHV